MSDGGPGQGAAREPAWRRRFTAPVVRFPRWSPWAPHRLALVSNESGSFQAWTLDLAGGERRRVSDDPVGVEEAIPTPNGDGVAWFHDDTGSEYGHWVVAPFEKGEGRPLLPDVPDGWAMGISLSPSRVAVALAHEDGYAVYVSEGSGPARVLHRHAQPLGVGHDWPQGAGGLSADGSLLCVRHCEHGDILHHALRVLDAKGGKVVGDLEDRGLNLIPAAWSPVPGDQRLALLHDRGAFERPAVWDLSTGEREDLEIDLPGAAFPLDWWPDGSALLLRHEHEGRDQLFRLDLATVELALVADPGGSITNAAVRPDGEVWLRAESSVHPPRIVTADGREVVAPEGDRAPEGRPYRSFWFENPKGQRIHAWVVEPPGEAPHPVVMKVHGGPEYSYKDAFDPEIQAFVDHGFAVAMVNYRGSSGYGVEFRKELEGNIGFPETEDVLACLDALVAEGRADPERVVLEGWSWGGYIALLAAGLNPDRWQVVIGGIPVGDYEACHYECSPPLRAWDLAILGGGPEDLPELYRERNPITYVNRVTAPVLIIAGENDSRCPIGQVMRYVDALRERGGRVDVHLYGTGHHALFLEETLRQIEEELAFALRLLHPLPPGLSSLG